MNNHLSRRKFVAQSSLAAMSLLPGNSLLKGFMEETKYLKQIGLIVNVIVNELKADWEGTLRKVAEIGYSHLEFRDYYGTDREYFKKFMKEIGLKPLSAGSSLNEMKKDDVLNKMIEDAHYLDKKYLICYWPWPDGGDNKKLDDFKKAAEELNSLGEKCNKAGIRFAMHNHDKEFVPVEGYRYGYEVLLKETDPSKVAMLMDLYWITKGGADPVEFLKQYPDRFELFHVKDMDNTDKKIFTCPGYGIIDFKKIFAQAKHTNVKHYIVEIDKADKPMDCIKDSFDYLRKLRF